MQVEGKGHAEYVYDFTLELGYDQFLASVLCLIFSGFLNVLSLCVAFNPFLPLMCPLQIQVISRSYQYIEKYVVTTFY